MPISENIILCGRTFCHANIMDKLVLPKDSSNHLFGRRTEAQRHGRRLVLILLDWSDWRAAYAVGCFAEHHHHEDGDNGDDDSLDDVPENP